MLNLKILENICAGTGVSVNISALAKSLKKHRNTINTQVMALFKNNIIIKPFYPFVQLFKERPLLAAVKADLPDSSQVERFLIEDKTIFAAFRAWDEVYNTLLFEFHEDIYSYYQWKERIVKQKKLPPLENRAPAEVLFFDNRLIIKYSPNSSIFSMEKIFKEQGELLINKYKLNELGFEILKKLLLGHGIKTNENLLAKKLNVHRRTIERRINDMVKAKIILEPVCRFPKFFVPPGYVLAFCLKRINKRKSEIFRYIRDETSIPIAYEGHTGAHNLLYFGTYPNVEKHFEWEDKVHHEFPDCLGAVKKVYLAPEMTTSIDQRKVSLGVIREKIEHLRGKMLMNSIR